MAVSIFDDEEFFGFSAEELDVDNTFNFTSKFKVIDSNGYKLVLHRLYKRSLSKKNLEVLNSIIEKNFPLSISDVSGIELESIAINKLYDGDFEISCLSDGTFDLLLGGINEK
jgi:archaellum biogenesis ATPase FlaH